MNSKVSIVITNHNWIKFNENCINSILKQNYTDFEIVFVDNISHDGSVEKIEEIFNSEIKSGKIKIVRNKNNEGFANANNIWHINASKESKYICLINNDTTVPKNRLEELVRWIESDKHLWAVAWLVLDAWIEKNLLETFLEKKETFTSNLFGEAVLKKVSRREAETWIYYNSNISWCCFFYKKSLVDIPFPEFYFAYAEDLFLSRYLLNKWYKLAICTKAIVYHLWSSTFGKDPSNYKLFFGNRNQIINYLVFYKVSTIFKLLPLFLLTQMGHLFVNAFWKRLWAKIRARWWIICHVKKIYTLKKHVKKNTNISEDDFIKELSYKFSDDVFYGNFWETKIKIIEKINTVFKFYYKYFL